MACLDGHAIVVYISYIDYYLIHCILKSNYQSVFEKYDCFNWLFDLKEKGLIKKAGFSYHDTADLLDEILTKYPQFDFVQLQINYLDWESNDIQSRLCYEVAVKHNIDVIVMEPIISWMHVNITDVQNLVLPLQTLTLKAFLIRNRLRKCRKKQRHSP